MNDDANKTSMMNESVVEGGPAADAQPGQAESSPAETAPAEISLEEFQALKARAAKADEHWGGLLRVSADFDNFKKRAARERQDGILFANQALLQTLIPVLDNFEAAVAAAADPKAGSADALKTGVNMICTQFKNALRDAGLEEIDATNKVFDPNLHEAVSHEESPGAAEGQILKQLRKGYKLRDRLIRPATVVVAGKPAA